MKNARRRPSARRRHATAPLAALLALAPTCLCQAPSVDDLLSEDWRERSAAGRAFAEAPPPAAELVRVLNTEWDGDMPSYGLFGGAGWNSAVGVGGPVDPRASVLIDARTYLLGSVASPTTHEFPLGGVEDLVAPAHPHEIALWLLRERASIDDDARRTGTTMPCDTVARARAWILLNEPDDAALAEEAGDDDERAGRLAAALWFDGDDGRDRLRRLLTTSTPTVRRAVLRIGDADLFDTPEAVAVAAEVAVRDDDDDVRKDAGSLLQRLGERAAPALAALCGEDRAERRRALGLLCLLEEQAAPAAEKLLQYIDSDRRSRRRALVALASFELPAALRGDVAAAAISIFDRRELQSQLLALDVLGNCGDGVDEATRARLRGMFPEPEVGGIKARLLGCLYRLGEVPADMTTEQKAYIAGTIHPTTETWLAVADDGPPGATALRGKRARHVDHARVVARLAQTAPHALRQWLDDDDGDVRYQALVGLRTLGDGADVSSERLAELAVGSGGDAREAIRWLGERDDRSRYAPRILQHVAATDGSWISTSYREFVAGCGLPLAQKLTLLEPVLKRGVGVEIVRGDDAALLRTEYRRWLAETEDTDVRDTLLGELCRLGLEPQDVAPVCAALRGEDRTDVLSGIEHGPSLPDEVRRAVEAIFDEERDDGMFGSYHATCARAALRAHR